jgi:hypothetical protein
LMQSCGTRIKLTGVLVSLMVAAEYDLKKQNNLLTIAINIKHAKAPIHNQLEQLTNFNRPIIVCVSGFRRKDGNRIWIVVQRRCRDTHTH